MDQSLDEWFKEYRRLSDALEPYCRRIIAKVSGPGAPQPLTEAERVFFDLCYYWGAALVNNGDVFGYVPFIIEHEADFRAVGALGTLRASAELMPYYREQQENPYQSEKDEYWCRTRDERAGVEQFAEDVHELAGLLLAYAKKNLPRPPNE